MGIETATTRCLRQFMSRTGDERPTVLANFSRLYPEQFHHLKELITFDTATTYNFRTCIVPGERLHLLGIKLASLSTFQLAFPPPPPSKSPPW